MNDANSTSTPIRWTKVLAVALGVAFLLHLHYLLMWYERDFFRRNHPEVISAWANNGNFTVFGVYSAEWDWPTNTAARVREVGEHGLPYDPYIKETRSKRLLMTDPAYFFSFGLVERLIGNIHVSWHVSRFLMCAAWVVLLYLIFRRAGHAGAAALVFAAAVTLFFELILNLWPNNPLALIKNTVKGAFWIFGKEMQWFGPLRTIQPLFAYAVFLAAGILVVKLAKGEGGRGAVIAAGVFGALVAHSHADVFVTYFAAVPVLIALKLMARKGFDNRLAASLAISLVLSVPMILLTHRTLEEWSTVVHSISGRDVNWPSLLYASSGAYAFLRQKDNLDLQWWGSICIAMFLLSNLQLITGITIEHYHYRWIGNFAVVMLFVCWFGRRLTSPQMCRFVLIVVSLIAAARAVSYAAQHYESYAIPKETEDGFKWLEENSEPDSIVGSLSYEVTVLTPVWSHNKTLVCRNVMLISDVSHTENARRFQFLCHLLAIPPSSMVPILTQPMPRSVLRHVFEGNDRMNREAREDYSGFRQFFVGTSAEYMSKIIRDTLNGPNVQPFAVDYLWVGDVERRRGVPADLAAVSPYSLDEVYRNASVTIYKVLGPK